MGRAGVKSLIDGIHIEKTNAMLDISDAVLAGRQNHQHAIKFILKISFIFNLGLHYKTFYGRNLWIFVIS